MAFSSSTVISGQVTKKTDYDRLMDNTVHILRSATTFTGAKTFTSTISANDGITVPVMHVQDQKTAGTHGGTFTSGAWRTRDLNTVLTNTITGASLASNQITLPAGTYKITTYAPAFQVNRHGTYFYNITDSKAELLSHSAIDCLEAESNAFMLGIITITGTKVFEVQHKCQSTFSTYGFGVELNSSLAWDHETYTDVFIEKLA